MQAGVFLALAHDPPVRTSFSIFYFCKDFTSGEYKHNCKHRSLCMFHKTQKHFDSCFLSFIFMMFSLTCHPFYFPPDSKLSSQSHLLQHSAPISSSPLIMHLHKFRQFQCAFSYLKFLWNLLRKGEKKQKNGHVFRQLSSYFPFQLSITTAWFCCCGWESNTIAMFLHYTK